MHSDNFMWLRDQVDGARAQERERREAVVADLRAKLAAAQARIAELEAAPAWPGWQPVEDGERVFCPCPDYSCSTEAWIEAGDLWIEDADEQRVSFHMGRDYAFVRRTGATNAAT